jgi:hypothetical protein
MPLPVLSILVSAPVILGISGLGPGAVVQLPPGPQPMVTITGQRFDPPVTIIATGADVAGLRITNSEGIVWKGGTIHAPGGKNAVPPLDRGVDIRSSAAITFDGVTFTNARNAILVDETDRMTVINSQFTDLRSDGIDATGVRSMLIENNDFSNFTPILPIGFSTQPGYVQGDHPDAVQFWVGSAGHPATDVIVRNNRIEGVLQGINTFGPTGSGHLRLTIEYNQLRIKQAAGISLIDCISCVIRFNSVETLPGAPFRANAYTRNSTGSFCGNRIVDVPRSPLNLPC